MNKRIETDSIGEIEVREDKYWGAQTERSLHYFSIGTDIMPSELVHALAIIKKSAALANHELGMLTEDRCKLIVQVADEILEGKLAEHFPLHVWMTGSATQLNMNVNEVISNRSIELAGGTMGSKTPVHPNDHVNMSQSSNDSIPTAMYISTALAITHRLLPAVSFMKEELAKKAEEWKGIIKIGRTHMQDAVPITLGQEFSGYACMMEDNIARLQWVLHDVMKLALGGTALGTGINTPKGFAECVVKKISDFTGLPFVPAPNKFCVQGAHDALVMVGGALKTLANSMYKISNDIRLLSCGPRAGFHELEIPSNEPGSSIMPGKVNPTQCEAMSMAAAQVIGYDLSITIGGASGMLDMNVYKPLMIFNIIQSVKILSDSCHNFTEFLLKGCKANEEKIQYYLNQSLMLVTALSPVIGYDKCSKLAHHAYEKNLSLEEANLELKFLEPDEFKKVLDPSTMV
jgi:fumarate hydratase class II